MTDRTDKAEPFAQTPLGSGVGLLFVGGLWTGLLKFLDTVPVWVTVLVYALLVVAFVLNLVPSARKGILGAPKALWSNRPVRHRRLEEATARADQADEARVKAERGNASLSREVDDLAEAVESTKLETSRIKSERDGVRRDLQDLKGEHGRLMAASLEAQKRAGEKGYEDGQNAGVKLGRLLEKYGDDYPELSPAQKADRRQEAQHREGKLSRLERTIVELQGRMSADHDEHVASLREQFEIGRRQGYDEAWKEVEAERGDGSGVSAPEAPALLRPPRWRVYRSWIDDPTSDEWTIYNPVPNSGIRSLRVEADRRLFTIRTAGDWPKVEDDQQEFTFEGAPTKLGRANGYTFTLTWQTEDTWPISVEIEPEEQDDVIPW